MKIIVLTYVTGYQVAFFKDDPQLLETILADHNAIDDMQQIEYEGRVFTPERALRELIRQQGKAMARRTFEQLLLESEMGTGTSRLYFKTEEK